MGSNCSGLKAGGESYSLAGDRHNKVHQDPHGQYNDTPTAVDLADQQRDELSSSRDVNLQVSQDEESPIKDESECKTTTTEESASSPTINDQKVAKADHGHAGITVADFSRLSIMTEDEANDIVNECWENIERTCGISVKTDQNLVHGTGWRVVRLFVSSTFADYHAERELLVKKVFSDTCQMNSPILFIYSFILISHSFNRFFQNCVNGVKVITFS